MVRRGRRKSVDPFQASRYIRIARALRKSAVDLAALAEEGDRCGNAIAIVALHAAIAYADAVSVAYGGFKSTEGDHERAVDTLKAALGNRADPAQLGVLLGVIKKKDVVSYQGIYYSVAEACGVLGRLDGFAEWAETMYEHRP